MAIEDALANISQVVDGVSLSIQPGSDIEWVIHNIVYGGAVEIYMVDSVNGYSIKFYSDVSEGAMIGMVFHCTNSVHYAVKNVSGSTIYVGYDGVVTK